MSLETISLQLCAVAILTAGTVSGFLLESPCPDCHWQGECSGHPGQCHCYNGFTAADCSLDCGCQGHGVCIADNTCQCDDGWTWSTRELRCVWACHCEAGVQCIGPGVCGCAHACQYGTCWQGQCECWEGYKGRNCSTYDPNIMVNRNVSVGINLGGVTYWSTELKFVDVAKASQDWITERTDGPHRQDWDTHEHDSVVWRPDGYPARLEPNMILVKLMLRANAGVHAPQGNYTILYEGQGDLGLRFAKQTIHYHGKGRMVVELHEGHSGVLLMLKSTNPDNPIHDIRVILPGFESRYKLFPFYPPFLENIMRFSEIRFMDFFHTNGHMPEPTTWSTRRLPNFHTQATALGGSVEYAVHVSNLLGASPWFNIPHAADDDFVRQFARLVRTTLRPDLTIYLEYSNEVWNGIFRQTTYNREQGTRLGLDTHAHRAGMKYYNIRSSEIMNIWANEFDSDADRLFPVWAWQTGYQDYTQQALDDLGPRISKFKAIGITGYFSCDSVATKHHKNIYTILGLLLGKVTGILDEAFRPSSSIPATFPSLYPDKFHKKAIHSYNNLGGHLELQNITQMSFDQIAQLCKDEMSKHEASFKHYVEVAKNHSVKLLMYEGGPGIENSRINDDNVTKQAVSFNSHALMEDVVTDNLEAWFDIVNCEPYNTHPGGLFNYFSSTGSPSKYGSWGMLEYTGQVPSTVPKYRAVQRYIERHFQNHLVAPVCSFLMSGTSVHGCFKLSSGEYRCGHSENHGNSWSTYPDIAVNGSSLVLDGLDSRSNLMFVRSVDTLAANTYYTLDTATHFQFNWTMLSDMDYHRHLASPHVLRRLPSGVYSHISTAHLHCPHSSSIIM